MANRYIFHSRISEAKFRHIVRLFALDLNAVQIAALTRISRVSINRHLAAMRRHMAWHCDQVQPMSGDIEVDESYFSARRVRGKRERGAVHINGIEGFWGFAKSRLAQFRGMNKKTFYLHLKECEFRFNHRHHEIYQLLLKSCRENPIKLS